MLFKKRIVQNFGASKIFFLERKGYTFIQQGCLKLTNSDSEDIYNVTKDFFIIINAVILNFL